MSKKILLRFGTRNLKRAEAIASKIAERMREVAAKGGEAGAAAAQIVKENSRILRQANLVRARLERRKKALNLFGADRDQIQLNQQAVVQRVQGVAGVLGTGAAVFEQIRSGNFASAGLAIASAGFLGPIGAVTAQVAGTVMTLIQPELEKVAKREALEIEARITSRLEERLEHFDLERRLRDDPEFRKRSSELFAQILAHEVETEQVSSLDERLGGF